MHYLLTSDYAKLLPTDTSSSVQYCQRVIEEEEEEEEESAMI